MENEEKTIIEEEIIEPVDVQPVEVVNQPEPEKNKNNKKKKIIIACIILGILIIAGIVFWLIYSNSDNYSSSNESTTKSSKSKKDKDKDSTDDSKNDDPSNNNETAVKTLYFYKYSWNGYLYVSDKILEGEKIVSKYDCVSIDCKNIDSTKNFALISDGPNNTMLYNLRSKKTESLNDTGLDFTNSKLFSLEDKLYAISLKDPNGSKYAVYSYDSKEKTSFVYQELYGEETMILTQNKIIAKAGDRVYIVNISTGEQLYSSQVKADYSSFSAYGNSKAMYIFESYAMDSYYIYDSKLNLLFDAEEKGFADYDIINNGNIRFTKWDGNTKFEEYDSTGKLVKSSKEYKNVELLVRGYIVAVDNDNNLNVYDTNENKLATLAKLTDDMYVHSMISGYYTKEQLNDSHKDYPEGIYMVVQDNTLECSEEDAEGCGYEYYYDVKTGKVGKIDLPFIGGYAKPVLYLYPESETTVTVEFAKPHLLTTTYPKYKDPWKVIAKPNGDLYYNNRYYYGLYWEESGSINVDFKEGFYVSADSAIGFLEEKLAILGFNEREANEFIMYWLPILEKNKHNLIYFEQTKSREDYNKLNITPKPDSLLRVAIHVKKVNSKTKIKEQKLRNFERNGFVAVEWGGVIH